MKVMILAGGSGSRLWPLSRNHYPKQFMPFLDRKYTLFQEAVLRGLKFTTIEDIIVVTSKDYQYFVESQIQELNEAIPLSNIILEPSAKNTLPAIMAGINWQTNDTYLVMPSDHLISPETIFVETIKASFKLANEKIVTFGIKPDSPKTGYGYIAKSDAYLNGFLVDEFKEKPNKENALKYIQKGYLWNAGIFLFSKNIIEKELTIYQPSLCNIIKTLLSIEEKYQKIETPVSIDYGLLEKSNQVATVPLDLRWNDLGSFDALDSEDSKDEYKNSKNITNYFHNASNNLVVKNSEKLVAITDVDDLIVVDTKDALLITKKGSSQNVKEIVNKLLRTNDSSLIK